MIVTLIHNRSAGEGTPEDALVAPLRAHGHSVAIFDSEPEAIEAALKSHSDVIVAAGGDGTVQKVAQRMIGKPVPLAIFLGGTANNIGRSVGAFHSPDALAVALTTAPRRSVDAAIATIGSRRHIFLESCGFGVITRLMHTLADRSQSARLRDRKRGFRAELERFRDLLCEQPPVEIGIDDQSDKYILVEALNTRTIGPDLPFGDGRVDDGLVELVCVHDRERERLDDFVRLTIRGQPPDPLPIRRVKTVDLQGPAADLHIDGDIDFEGDVVSVKVSTLPGTLQIIAPRK